MNLAVRCAGDPRALAAPVRAQVFSIDKQQPVTDVRTMEQHLATSITPNRLTALLLVVFSAMALIVATVGLYGLIAYSTAQRTQEMGIRVALGALPGDLRRLVLRQGLLLGISGVALGLAGSYGLSRLIESLLYEVSPTDTWTFGFCAALLLAITLLASYVPAQRAARCDPCLALRHE